MIVNQLFDSVRLLRILFALLFVSMCPQLTFAQGNAESPASSLLDDLLTPAEDQNAQKQPDGDEVHSLAEELVTISTQMDLAATDLAGSTGLDAQSLVNALLHQQEAIDALNRLLQKNGTKMSSKPSGDKQLGQQQKDSKEQGQPKNAPSGSQQGEKDSQSPSEKQQSGDKPGKQQAKSEPDPNAKQNDQNNPSGQTVGQNAKGLPGKETVVDLLKSVDTSGQANWGKLPQRLRDQMQNSGSLEFTRGYERQTRDYFRNLNDALLKLKQVPKR